MENKNKIFAVDGREDLVQNILKSYNRPSLTSDTKDILFRGEINVEKYSDGEIKVSFGESVRGSKVYLLCSTNNAENIIKLLLAIGAAESSSAEEIIAVIPYYGYSRQDRREFRGTVGARKVADWIKVSGAHRIISVDLHAEQIQGFFGIPSDHVSGKYIFPEYIEKMKLENLTLCSPDAGGVKRVDRIFKKLQEKEIEANMVMLSKRRDKPNSIESMELIGDVKDRNVIIIDDIVDTAGTLCKAADELMKFGARSVRAICTHGILSGPAIGRIHASESLKEIIISDSLPDPPATSGKIKVVSCAPALSDLIRAINNKQSANVLEESHK